MGFNGHYHDKDYILKQRIAHLGIKNPLNSRKFTAEHRNKISKSNIGKHSFPNRVVSAETKRKMSESHLKNWSNLEFYHRRLHENLRTNLPSSFEKKIIKFIALNNLPYLYTGDGRFLINTKNPDFVNFKNKKIIEVYYSFWKISWSNLSAKAYENKRRETFKSAGYSVLFLNEIDLKNESYKQKILQF